MKLTANNIIKLFIDAIGQDAFKDFYEHNWEARKKEIQKLLKTEYDFDIMLATIENNHYESGENHQKKSKRKSHYYNNSKGSTIVLANNAQKIGANE